MSLRPKSARPASLSICPMLRWVIFTSLLTILLYGWCPVPVWPSDVHGKLSPMRPSQFTPPLMSKMNLPIVGTRSGHADALARFFPPRAFARSRANPSLAFMVIASVARLPIHRPRGSAAGASNHGRTSRHCFAANIVSIFALHLVDGLRHAPAMS